jgi:hypothetical protein
MGPPKASKLWLTLLLLLLLVDLPLLRLLLREQNCQL